MQSGAHADSQERELRYILAHLRRHEPIFHMPAFGSTAEDYAARMPPDYWEVGASGSCYGRAWLLEELNGREARSADDLEWETRDHAIRELGPDTYLFTYMLDQRGRRSRRATIWRRDGDVWQILYHQGTPIADNAVDTRL